MDLAIIRYTSLYYDVLEQIKNEIEEEKQDTKLCFFDEKNSYLVMYGDVVIGFCCIPIVSGIPNIQVGVLKQYRGRGYGSAIVDFLTKKYFLDGYPRAEMFISKTNIASRKMAEKAGYYRDYSLDEFNLYNDDKLYLTYYKNNYRYINRK